MSEFAAIGGQLAVQLADTADANGVQVTAAASANTMGAWVQLVAADDNPFGSNSVEVCFHSDDTGPAEFLVNIGIDATDTMIVLPALRFVLSPNSNGRVGAVYRLPMAIPAGVAVYAQCQCSTASKYLYVGGSLFAGGYLAEPGPAQVVPIGADYGASKGVSFVAGGVNSWGTAVELAAATDFDFRGFFVGLGSDGETAWATQAVRYRLGIGASANEHWLYTWRAQYSAAEAFGPAGGGFVPIQIPAGTRLAIQAMADTGNVAARTKDIIFYGVR